MGVDYSGVGGLGINLSYSDVMSHSVLCNNGEFDLGTIDEVLSDKEIKYSETGYGAYKYYDDHNFSLLLLVGTDKYTEFENEVPIFLEKINSLLGTTYTKDDLRCYHELLVW